MSDIYTFGPTFRAENSQTSRHLAEFHMIEPELAFCDLSGVMDNAEQYVKFCVKQALEKCEDDLAFFNQFYDKTLLGRLEKVVHEPFVKVSYRDAVALLQVEIAKDPSKWQFPEVHVLYIEYQWLCVFLAVPLCLCCWLCRSELC